MTAVPSMPAPAPIDPRVGWSLPDFGAMPTVAVLDGLTIRVLAGNPSPMTLDGTNTYVLGPSTGPVAVLDPGPDDPAHLVNVEDAIGDRTVAAVVVTHHHVDHAEAARSWASRFGCRVHASTYDVAGPDGVVLADGDLVDVPGLELRVVATPGHCGDHLAFRAGTGALLTGDHVLGRGTSVVAHPDGDLSAYLDSLRRTLELGPDVLYPGHGPELTEDATAVIAYYLEHRHYREQQILAVLAVGPHTPRQIVEIVYADVAEILWPAAEASTRAALQHLSRDGRVVVDGDVAKRVGS